MTVIFVLCNEHDALCRGYAVKERGVKKMFFGQHAAVETKTKQRNYDTNKIAFFYTPGVHIFAKGLGFSSSHLGKIFFS